MSVLAKNKTYSQASLGQQLMIKHYSIILVIFVYPIQSYWLHSTAQYTNFLSLFNSHFRVSPQLTSSFRTTLHLLQRTHKIISTNLLFINYLCHLKFLRWVIKGKLTYCFIVNSIYLIKKFSARLIIANQNPPEYNRTNATLY